MQADKPRGKYPKTGKRGAPQAFAHKLWEIMVNEAPHSVAWSCAGSAFVIRDQEKFVKQTLLKYFRHQKFSSFQRQLNLYGFRKIHRGPDNGGYKHPCFLRGHPELLINIRRSTQHNHNPRGTCGRSRHHVDNSDEEDLDLYEDEDESDLDGEGDEQDEEEEEEVAHNNNNHHHHHSDSTQPPDYEELVKSLKHMSSSSCNRRKLRRIGSNSDDNNNNHHHQEEEEEDDNKMNIAQATPIQLDHQLLSDLNCDVINNNNNNTEEATACDADNTWILFDIKSDKSYNTNNNKTMMKALLNKLQTTSIDSGSVESAFLNFGAQLADGGCSTPPLEVIPRPVSLKRLLSGNLDMMMVCSEPYDPDVNFDELFGDD